MEKAGKATWIWYPGDFEIWLGNKMNNRRTERGAIFPPFWKQDSHWPTVEFSKAFTLEKDEEIHIYAEGSYNFMLDGKLQFGQPDSFLLTAGGHKLNIKVHNQITPPALLIQGESLYTDSSWLATYEDKIWIDENGVAHGSGIYVPAACWNFDTPEAGPSSFHLCRSTMQAQSKSPVKGRLIAILYDFGKETFGFPVLKGLSGEGSISLYYGESSAEALDCEHCETLDRLSLSNGVIRDLGHKVSAATDNFTLPESKAYRYVCVECDGTANVDGLAMEYEYLPQNESKSGSFRCSDDLLNEIWKVSAYTMDLTTREFFVDGIKRDRWVWSGDAIQSYLMNYYLRFDTETVKRTIRQLRGKDPVTAHVNTIMDYTFYWFKSILDYYQYSGDIDFVREMYPKMVTLMDYCLSRTIKQGELSGMMEGQPDDWIFVDWVDFPMHKRGIMCFEQILFAKSLETMSVCAGLLGEDNPYDRLAQSLREKTDRIFWDEDCHAYLHNIEEGQLNPMVTKFPNMFAINFGYTDENRQQEILENVMHNDQVEAITTPYMRFYELEALCKSGMQKQVKREIKSYWGGMLKEQATTFWEKYIPSEKGPEHLQMYGRPFGKSLCHAWGASPIYLLGKYFLGVQPLKPGYEEVEIRPELADMEWMEGAVPTPKGLIHVKMDRDHISGSIPSGKGYVYFNKKYEKPVTRGGELEQLTKTEYRLCVEAGKDFEICL